jgi:hypothetical protein
MQSPSADYSSKVGKCHEICQMHSRRKVGLALRRLSENAPEFWSIRVVGFHFDIVLPCSVRMHFNAIRLEVSLWLLGAKIPVSLS